MSPQMQKINSPYSLELSLVACGHRWNFQVSIFQSMLLDPGALSASDCAGRTPLMRAAQLGVPRLCAALLAAKADVNAPGPQSDQAKEVMIVMAVVELGTLPITI